jgi:hypothetical protein
VIAPVPAAAASSPTECPATAPTWRKASAGCGNRARAAAGRLRDRGVADGVGVGLGPVVDEVEIDDRGPPGEPVGDAGHVEPWRQKAGSLSSLAGSDKYEHAGNLLVSGPKSG